MSIYLKGLTVITLIALPLILRAAGPVITAMTQEELNTAITELHKPALVEAWAVFGNETRNRQRNCVTQRNIYIFSVPKHINDNLLRSDMIEVSFNVKQRLAIGCGRLVKGVEQHLTAAKFVDGNTDYSSTVALAKTFFKIRGELSNNQLIELGDLISNTRECILHKRGCKNLNLTINLPDSIANRLNSISKENIASVQVLPSPNNTGPYLISFKPYPAYDLLMDVHGLGTKKQLVGIGYVLP